MSYVLKTHLANKSNYGSKRAHKEVIAGKHGNRHAKLEFWNIINKILFQKIGRLVIS